MMRQIKTQKSQHIAKEVKRAIAKEKQTINYQHVRQTIEEYNKLIETGIIKKPEYNINRLGMFFEE